MDDAGHLAKAKGVMQRSYIEQAVGQALCVWVFQNLAWHFWLPQVAASPVSALADDCSGTVQSLTLAPEGDVFVNFGYN